MRSGLVRIVVQHEAGNDFGFADRRIGLLEDSFVEREKAQAGITPPVVVIGPVDGAGQSVSSWRLLGCESLHSFFTAAAPVHEAMGRLQKDVCMRQSHLPASSSNGSLGENKTPEDSCPME